MLWLVLGVLIWTLSHLMKRLAPGLSAALGEGPRKGLVTALTLLALGLMILGYRSAPVTQLWDPPTAMRHLNNLLMLVAVVLVNMKANRGSLRRLMRHPMLTAVILWAVAHLMVNGDLAALILWGGLGMWAVLDILVINRTAPAWSRPAPGPLRNDLIYLAFSAVVFAAIVGVHTWLGYPPLGSA